MSEAATNLGKANGIGRWTAALSIVLCLRALGFGVVAFAARTLRTLSLERDLKAAEAVGRVIKAIAVYIWAGIATVGFGGAAIVLLVFWFRKLRDRLADGAKPPQSIAGAVTRCVVPVVNAIFAPAVLAAHERAVFGRTRAPISTLWRITALAALAADVGVTVFLANERDSSQVGLGHVALGLAIGAGANCLLTLVSALYVVLVGRRASAN